MGVREVFEVLYSPVKAFKKIIEKPDFKGILLILVLVMLSVVAEHYVFASKFFLETRTPDDENWTESIQFWGSNGDLSLDDSDYKVGNYSVKSFVSNGTSIWMNINDIGPFDCFSETGYKELFFWIKWIHENGTFPSFNATLRLFSSGSSFFESDLTNLISSSNDEWSNATINNATLKIGLGEGWSPINSPDWTNVTGLEFKLAWLTSANLTMKIDDLHFTRYVTSIETGEFNGLIIYILMWGVAGFSMNWLLWASVLLLILRVFKEKGGPWPMFFIIIGHVFSITIVYALVSTALFSALPSLKLPSDVNAADALIRERWYPNLAFQLWNYVLPFVYFIYAPSPLLFFLGIWTMALCTIAIRFLCGITWGKAVNISMVAFTVRFLLGFLFGF